MKIKNFGMWLAILVIAMGSLTFVACSNEAGDGGDRTNNYYNDGGSNDDDTTDPGCPPGVLDKDNDGVCDDVDQMVDIDGNGRDDRTENIHEMCYCDELGGWGTMAHPEPNAGSSTVTCQDTDSDGQCNNCADQNANAVCDVNEPWVQLHDKEITGENACFSWRIPKGDPEPVDWSFSDSTDLRTTNPDAIWYAEARVPCNGVVLDGYSEKIIFQYLSYTPEHYVADPNIGYGYPLCNIPEDNCFADLPVPHE